MTFRLNQSFPIVDSNGIATQEFFRAVQSAIEGAVIAALAQQAATQAQTTADTAQSAATTAQTTAQAANDNANTRQPASSSLTALAALSGAGLVEQTGVNAFSDRAIGVGASSSIPTRGDADGRYIQQGQTSHPSYSAYGGQTVSAAYVQAEAQTTDNALKALATVVASINSKLQTIGAFT